MDIVTVSRVIEALSDLAMAAAWAEPLSKAMARFEIDTARRAAMFLAQAAHESDAFTRTGERLNYSAKRLTEVWPGRFPTLEAAEPYAGNPEALANKVYANRMGNGPPESGDGWRYRGSGLFGLTGRNNFRRSGKALGLPLEEEPERVRREPDVAALTAAEYWHFINGNMLADDGHITLATKRVNGGLIGIEDRKHKWATAKKALGV